MAEGKIKSLFIEDSYNATTDNSGRIELPIPIGKLINVWVNENDTVVFPRYLPSNPQHCLVYAKGPDIWEARTDRNLTVYYRYIP